MEKKDVQPGQVFVYNEKGHQAENVWKSELAVFVGHGDSFKGVETGSVYLVRQVPYIQKKMDPNLIIFGSNRRACVSEYTRFVMSRKGEIPFVPSCNYLGVDMTAWKPVIPEWELAQLVCEVPLHVKLKMAERMRDEIIKAQFTPLERIRLELDEQEIAAAAHKRWTSAKRKVLRKLWGRFEPVEIAEFFGMDKSVIEMAASNIGV